MTRVTLRQFWAATRLFIVQPARSTYLVAAIALTGSPILIAVLVVLVAKAHGRLGNARDVFMSYEMILRMLFLHFIVFFTANLLGFSALRQEREDQTLHYLFLQPIEKWLVALGKAASFLLFSSVICIISQWLTYLILTIGLLGLKPAMAGLLTDGRALALVKESVVIALGILAYGSIAMFMGVFFKSATYAMILLLWESALPYLPSSVKFFTLMHYLHSMLPERLQEQRKLFEMLGEPAADWLSLTVLLSVSLAFMLTASLIFHFRECLYAEA